MHRSRLCTIMIDCSGDTMEAGIAFWSQTLGMHPTHPQDPADPYVPLAGNVSGLEVLLQRVGAPSHIHLDIETDDVEAEVRRLEALGAQRHAQVETWWIMRAPTGHLFCVVPQQHPNSLDQAHTWDS
jgi:hypothetical protein